MPSTLSPPVAPPATTDPTGDWFQDASPSQQAVLRTLERIQNFGDLDTRPNRESLLQCGQASFNDFEVVPGTYKIPLSELGDLAGYSNARDRERIENLAAAIKESGEIEPVFVALDQEGLWLVEGQHRSRALRLLGYDSVPARVMVDLDDVPEPELEVAPAEKAFRDWFGKSTVVDDAGEPIAMYRGTVNPHPKPFNDDGLVFLTASEDFARNYARGGTMHVLHVRCEKPFDASRGQGLALWKEFVAETGAESWATQGSDRGALPYWTQETKVRAWLDAKGVDYDGIWFAESNHTASLAVRSIDQVQDAALRHAVDPAIHNAEQAKAFLSTTIKSPRP